LFVLLAACNGFAQEVRDSVKIHFRQGYSKLDLNIKGNKEALDRIADSLRTSYADSIYTLGKIRIVGGASPEGSIPLNKRLSEKRAGVLFDYLSAYASLPDSLKTFSYIGRDWAGLLALVEKDDRVPCRDEVIAFLRDVVARCAHGERASDRNLARLMALGGGRPYAYMYRYLFPELRASQVILTYYKTLNPVVRRPMANAAFHAPAPAFPELKLKPVAAPHHPEKPFYMALKTNMLYDALMVPNAGLEFYLGRDLSIAVNWEYAWWNSDRRHWYWRIYGGDIAIRKWVGRKAKEKPLTGHHVGIYGQVVTWDFETGGRGYMGGEPGGTMFDRCNFAAGVEYGYSLPVAPRLNIDFTVGVGYLGGKYYEYLPIDDCYVWQRTRSCRYFGPTKAEVSLVWLLGRGNVNRGKGGKR